MFEVEGLSFEQYFSINDVKVHKRIFKQFQDGELGGWRQILLHSPCLMDGD